MSETYKQQYEKVVVALTVAYEKLEKTGEALRAAIAMRDENWQKYTDAIDRINAANAEAGRFERERDEARELLLQTRSHLADFKTLWSRAIKERDEALAERDAERRRAEKDEVDLDGMVMAFKAADQRISELSAKLAAALARAEDAERKLAEGDDDLRAALVWVDGLAEQASCAFCAPSLSSDARARMVAHASECPGHPLREALDQLRAVEAERDRLRSDYCTCVVCGAELLPPDAPPHCLDCHPTEEHEIEWEEARAALREQGQALPTADEILAEVSRPPRMSDFKGACHSCGHPWSEHDEAGCNHEYPPRTYANGTKTGEREFCVCSTPAPKPGEERAAGTDEAVSNRGVWIRAPKPGEGE